jgi:putative DNA primase/helicase
MADASLDALCACNRVDPIIWPALGAYASQPLWVVWRYERPEPGADLTKVPYQAARPARQAKNNDSSTWCDLATALRTYTLTRAFDGIGINILGSNICAFDIDGCRNPENGLLHPWAQQLVERAQTYAEVTPSCRGIRIIGRGSGPKVHRTKLKVDDGVKCEAYRGAERYITVTGNVLPGAPQVLNDIGALIDEVVAELDSRSAGDSDEGESAPTEGTAKLPPMLESLLHIPNLGAQRPHGGYLTRSELMFAFVTAALRARVSNPAIATACLDSARRGCAIYEHCKDKGGREYVERQIKRARKMIREAGSEMMTDLGNARRLVRLHGGDLRYVHAWHSWVAWETNRWRRDGDGTALRMAKATVEEMFAEAAQIADEARRTAMRTFAIKSQSAQRLEAMVKLATTEIQVVLAADKIDADPYLLGLENGVVDLRKVEFREARRDDYVTKAAGTAFDARAECPEWEAFLSKIFPKGDRLMFVLWGVGSNGKSTFRETVFSLLGDYAVGSDASLLIANKNAGGATPDVARLHGRRLITINETEQHSRLNEARVKFITGHDTITARNLYEEPFDFAPTHKTFLTTNHKPIVRGTDEGIWRRLHLLPFTHIIPVEERDRHFRQKKLMPEMPGILNWALEGLKAYWRDGLNPPQEVLSATQEYRDDMDIVGQWIEERCCRNPASVEKVAGLHRDYEQWSRGEIGFSMTVVAFGRELSDRGFVRTRVGNQRAVRGLALAMQTDYA